MPAHALVQASRDLSERATLDGMDQFLEHVAAAFNDRGKTVERALGSGAVPVFEFLQAVHLKLFLLARRADHFDRRRRVGLLDLSWRQQRR